MAQQSQDSAERAIVRWRVFLPVCLFGLALTGASVATSVVLSWQGIWPSVFLEFGATILLGSLLYVGQRSFVQVVRLEARTVVQSVSERADVLEQRLGEQTARIDTIAQDVENARAVRHADEDSALAAITNDMTYEAVSGALREAERSRAISQRFRVRASADLRGMRIYLKNLVLMDRVYGGSPVLALTPWFPDARTVQQELWRPGEDVATVMGRIIVRLEEVNVDASKSTFNPELLFENLRSGLGVAVRSRRGEIARLRGPLIELTDDRWALTEAGLESRTDDVYVPIDLFPSTLPQFQDPDTPPFAPPDTPEGYSHDAWEVLMDVARKTYLSHGSQPVPRKGFSV